MTACQPPGERTSSILGGLGEQVGGPRIDAVDGIDLAGYQRVETLRPIAEHDNLGGVETAAAFSFNNPPALFNPMRTPGSNLVDDESAEAPR